MGHRSNIGVFIALSLLANGFCVPHNLRLKRQNGDANTSNDSTKSSDSDLSASNSDLPPPVPYDDDNDDDSDLPAKYPSDGGGSNVFSLLKLVTAFLPGSSSSSKIFHSLMKEIIRRNMPKIIIRRQDTVNNEIDIDYITDLKPPPFQRQESSETNESDDSNGDSSESNDAGEESFEENDERNNSDQESDSNIDDNDDDDDDYDEPPGGGDDEGGGILGLLAGLSGGEDGQSDLGSLLATISGIIANLSGDGIDLNALIASGIGLFVGLLSEGEENPGAIIASYLLTSLDTITGGGANNNGAFFGKFLSKLIKGTSAAGDPDASSEEDNGDKPKMADSAGFFISLIMSLLGDMSKGSSGSHPWRRHFSENFAINDFVLDNNL